MRSLFITATGTNVGKTHTTVKLIEALGNQGISVGVFKPIETGVSDTPPDAAILLEACQKVNKHFTKLTTNDITAYTLELPAAPFCADPDNHINLQYIMERHEALSALCDILLVEGAGGLMVPITQEYMMINLIKEMNAKALLVTPDTLGCINETLLSILALRTFDIDFDWCVNRDEKHTDFAKVTQPFYDAVFPGWWCLEAGLETFVNTL